MQYLETVLTDYPRINELNNVERCAFVQEAGLYPNTHTCAATGCLLRKSLRISGS